MSAGDVRILEEADLPSLRQFILAAFGLKEPPLGLRDDVLRWKYITPHPFWKGGRGYTRWQQGALVASCCLIPLRLLTPAGPVTCAQIIDWAASRLAAGAGLRLYLHMASLTETTISVGGSKDTRQILPKIGARMHQVSYSWQRMVRPWGAFQALPKNWKAPARLARDLLRCLPLVPRPDDHWSATAVKRFDSSVQPVLPDPAIHHAVISERTVELLNYWLDFPAAEMQGYLVRYREEMAGYFLLSFVGPYCRVIDLWLDRSEPGAWSQAYRVAYHVARRDPRTVWFETMNCLPHACEALAALGFKKAPDQVFLLDKKQRLPEGLPIALSMADFDAFYM